MRTPPVRFVTAPDGVRLAYAVYGDGPPLVWAAHWLTHLEYAWESPVWRHMVEFFARHFTVVRYDERGCGLSDWTDKNLDLDTWVADLGVIVDSLGIERFDLFGLSQGGLISIEYAVRYPERVRNLILCGSFPSGAFIPDAQRTALGQLIETGWGQRNAAFRQLFTSLFIPNATEEQRNWFNELQRKSTSPELAAKLYHAFQKLDVSDRLRLVSQPTLVMHAENDAAIPFALGRALAAEIPNAHLVTLGDANHITLESSPAWPVFCREILAFTRAEEAPPIRIESARHIETAHDAASAALASAASDSRPSAASARAASIAPAAAPAIAAPATAALAAATATAAPAAAPATAASAAAAAAPSSPAGAAPASTDPIGTFRFGRCVLESRARELWRDGKIVPIEHRAFDTLVYLIEHRERAVSKEELQEAIWPRMILTESALTRCVMKARRAVGDDSQRQKIIKTVHGHGYRFVAPLSPDGA